MNRETANRIADDVCRCRTLEADLDDTGERIADLRDEVAQLEERLHAEHLLALNLRTERDAAHQEVARLLDLMWRAV